MMTAMTLAAGMAIGQTAPTLKKVKALDGVRAVCLAASPVDSRFVAGMENAQVRVMDAAGKAATVTFTGHAQPAYGAAISPDGKYVLSGDEQAKIFLWDAKTGKLIREYPRAKGHTRGIQSIAFSADGKQFVSVGKDDAVCLWNVSGGDPVAKVVGEPANYYGAGFTKAGSVFAGTQAEGLRLLAPKTLKTVQKMVLPGGQGANGFAMNRAGSRGVTCGRDGVVTVFDLVNKSRLKALTGHTDFVTAADFTPNGKFAATTSIDGTLRLWDMSLYKQVAEVDGRSYVGSPVAFTGDGKYMVSTNASDTVEIHIVSPAQPVAKAPKRR
ncbi:MAG: WD40 repeat domain-containing protein [Armatimonadetes bacterium]|nr:WD40 repeat domain-containing protein [Armatimonadota bacterium]MBX3108523.1 WD40 repeat domain-containing protein [Fimbriimonadaceae bacterium]